MDDIPQGGAGGVPLHHDDEEPPQDHRPDGDEEEAPVVKTVRGGTPVAEQRTGTGQDEDTDGTAGAQPDDRD